ncbi:DUF808 domain-containing protein [Rhodovulum strictum]|uniref:DUF808 family protein n=1 Tax=Rhodovulum strictum TaxID=58314 RepID=A0A844BHP8_9RHOB|nr:DUF808 domain-containing protein [Rhodovulum strictum]MRH21015.1 DUF808 family protein [Rhodovulum strictum]
MSGLLALLDDVAAIAKVAAASVDDVMGQAVKASSQAAGAVIDDAAVTPKYVHGFSPDRELPIVWGIAKGSAFNKLVILLPLALVLSAFAPGAIAPLLMLGGAYLCFEGAEKIWHALHPGHDGQDLVHQRLADPHLEANKVKGAIKTDFILSAEIMTITLAALPEWMPLWQVAGALAVAGLIITVAVYGVVGLIVKADDAGLAMAAKGRLVATRALGLGIVRGMPHFMRVLVVVGTAAMIWVGGSIILHGLYELGAKAPYLAIHHIAATAAQAVPEAARAAAEWVVTAGLDGMVGLALGALMIPLVRFAILPVAGLFRRKA